MRSRAARAAVEQMVTLRDALGDSVELLLDVHTRLDPPQLEPQADTYWIRRDPPGPPPESLKNQF